MEIIDINLGDRSYEIKLGDGLLNHAIKEIEPFLGRKKIHIIADEKAFELHGAHFQKSIDDAKIEINVIRVKGGEKTKSFSIFEEIIENLLLHGTERGDLIIAFGGGVVGDLAGFVAGVVNRGIDFIQIPTTLLSQVDSSVGGKTAINAKAGKNLVGIFHQPRLVLIDTEVLNTLDKRDLMAGFAEIFKIGLINDFEFFEYCVKNFKTILNENGAHRLYSIKKAVEAKARIVIEDEKEKGVRALLNLGHTFAHAIEASVEYDETIWRHGEAVANGIYLAAKYSHRIGVLEQKVCGRICNFIQECGYRIGLDDSFSPKNMIATMLKDKKSSNSNINLILLRNIGDAYVHKNADASDLEEFLTLEIASGMR